MGTIASDATSALAFPTKYKASHLLRRRVPFLRFSSSPTAKNTSNFNKIFYCHQHIAKPLHAYAVKDLHRTLNRTLSIASRNITKHSYSNSTRRRITKLRHRLDFCLDLLVWLQKSTSLRRPYRKHPTPLRTVVTTGIKFAMSAEPAMGSGAFTIDAPATSNTTSPPSPPTMANDSELPTPLKTLAPTIPSTPATPPTSSPSTRKRVFNDVDSTPTPDESHRDKRQHTSPESTPAPSATQGTTEGANTAQASTFDEPNNLGTPKRNHDEVEQDEVSQDGEEQHRAKRTAMGDTAGEQKVAFEPAATSTSSTPEGEQPTVDITEQMVESEPAQSSSEVSASHTEQLTVDITEQMVESEPAPSSEELTSSTNGEQLPVEIIEQKVESEPVPLTPEEFTPTTTEKAEPNQLASPSPLKRDHEQVEDGEQQQAKRVRTEEKIAPTTNIEAEAIEFATSRSLKRDHDEVEGGEQHAAKRARTEENVVEQKVEDQSTAPTSPEDTTISIPTGEAATPVTSRETTAADIAKAEAAIKEKENHIPSDAATFVESTKEVSSSSGKENHVPSYKVPWDLEIYRKIVPMGLPNTGVDCYRSVAMQTLMWNPKFVYWILHLHSIEDCVTEEQEQCLTCIFRDFTESYLAQDKKLVLANYKRVHSYCRKNNYNPGGENGQGDPDDQLRWFLNRMEDELPKEVYRMFGSFSNIVQESRMTCTCCGKVTLRQNISEGLFQISTQSGPKVCPRYHCKWIEEMLEDQLENEKICGFKCDNCKDDADKIRKWKISEAPDMLTVQFKRFRYDGLKDNLDIAFDDVLDLTPFLAKTGAPRSAKYALNTVTTHSGRGTQSGHYRVLVKHPLTGKWSMIDDHDVDQSEMEWACNVKKHYRGQTAYLLSYTRMADEIQPKVEAKIQAEPETELKSEPKLQLKAKAEPEPELEEDDVEEPQYDAVEEEEVDNEVDDDEYEEEEEEEEGDGNDSDYEE